MNTYKKCYFLSPLKVHVNYIHDRSMNLQCKTVIFLSYSLNCVQDSDDVILYLGASKFFHQDLHPLLSTKSIMKEKMKTVVQCSILFYFCSRSILWLPFKSHIFFWENMREKFSVIFFHQKEQYRHAKPPFSAFQLNSLNSKCVRFSPLLLVLKSCITVSFALQKAQQKPLKLIYSLLS